MSWQEFREVCKEDAYLWHQNGNTADDLSAEDILNEYPGDYFGDESADTDDLYDGYRSFSPAEFAEQTLEYLKEMGEEI